MTTSDASGASELMLAKTFAQFTMAPGLEVLVEAGAYFDPLAAVDNLPGFAHCTTLLFRRPVHSRNRKRPI
jgi:hypothetical protein